MPLRHSYSIAIKIVSRVEADREASNQHELNGAGALRAVLGNEPFRGRDVAWVSLSDDDEPIRQDTALSWYDAREAHPTRTEWRLYYRGEPAIHAGGPIAILRRDDRAIAVVVAPPGSTAALQLVRVFGEPPQTGVFETFTLASLAPELGPIAQTIFEAIGWEESPSGLDHEGAAAMAERYGEPFPATAMVSAFAREWSRVDGSSPDSALMTWWACEEAIFRAAEDLELRSRLERDRPFESVDDFLKVGRSVFQRRSARAGHALEHHVAALLDARGIRYSRNATTEHRCRPDFLFPGQAEYADPSFPVARLSMIGAKTTCRDRWRQVTAEAKRIERKHLLTLEAAISSAQIGEMSDHRLVLVAPTPVLATYKPPAGAEVMSVGEMIDELVRKQASH